MKNLMIYISPTHSFNNPNPLLNVNDAGQLVKVQIENNLDLGWKLENILLFTNFKFSYGSINSHVIEDVEFIDKKPQTSKINAIVKLFEDGVIKNNELYWFHDLDAFQLQTITESEIQIEQSQIALTDYGRMPKWNTGSIFFRSGSKDIFLKIKELVYKKNIDEERALGILTSNNKGLARRVKKINKTYNFTPFNLRSCYKMAIKPIKIVHFHPLGTVSQMGIEKALDFYMGDNCLGESLLTNRLIKIFKFHRIR